MNTIWMTWGEVFNASLQNLWWGFMQFVPKLIVAILFFIIGWVLGNLIAKAFEHVIAALKVDNLFKSVKADDFFRKAGMNLNTGYFVGQVMKWFVVLVFLLPSLNLVGLDSIAPFLQNGVLPLLPRIFVAAFILIIATIVADFISRTISAGSKAMNLRSANMIGAIAKYAIWVFAFIIALGQLGVASEYMLTLFQAVVYMLALAGALAFGLGAKDHAGRLISKIGDEMRHRD